MNKKLFLAAITLSLAVGCAQATDITGITGSGGVYNIKPEHFSGDAGYRRYTNFKLDNGHVANLEFKRDSGTQPNAFINLVDNKVEINGILNSTRDGKFFNGHTVFITPGGFLVGSTGVVNVGRLSVATPTASKYGELTTEYTKASPQYELIGRQVSKLTQNSAGGAGAADITIQGKVFATEGVAFTGKDVSVPGHIVNGVKRAASEDPLTTAAEADTLFSALVKTDGSLKDATKFVQNGSRILIKSTDSMAVSGTVTNGAVAASNTEANVGTFLTNNGANGMAVSGKVYDNSNARLYNTAGKLDLNNGAEVNGKHVIVQNKGTTLTVNSGAKLAATDKLQVVNNGTGNLVLNEGSSATSAKDADIINDGAGFMKASGTISAAGNLAFRNRGTSMLLEGDITNTGATAVRNKSGKLTINGELNNTGNMGIINEGSDIEFSSTSEVTNEGKLKIASTEDATGDMTLNGKIENSDGEIRIYNDHGKLSFGAASSTTNDTGNLYIVSRKEGTGIVQANTSTIEATDGNLVIRNSGQETPSTSNGLDLKGTVKATNGTVAINNDKGNMYLSSNVTVSGGNLGIINRGNGGTMTAGGKVTVTDGNVNIKNFGNGNMTVSSELTHDGRVNVLANSGKLTLSGQVHNNSGALGANGGFYAAARQQTGSSVYGTGIKVTSAFVVDGNGEVLIKNITGNDGLDYEGTINTTNHQAALVNKKGDMNVSGSITTTNAPVIVSNQGKKLTVSNSATLNSGTPGVLVNTGSEAANFGNPTLNNVTKYEQVKYNGPNGFEL